MSDFPVLLVGLIIFACIWCVFVWCYKFGARGQTLTSSTESYAFNEAAILREEEDTLDLHYLSWNNAETYVANFLRKRAHDYDCGRSNRYCFIITGQGKGSPFGQPVLKPRLGEYLDSHGYSNRYTLVNPGKFKVDLA
ncbi:NEDD4-binding protein 2 [Elysia marginata]|uniref:NEDD4-binding protein 2 n=1 Tax=Elysia marginata TaxID=1093978 RepID=A0AAV4JVB8_9GAST|nr:NEDD4-binding protein 2 [Elysia marginata]